MATFTETFNKADGNTLGPNLTWDLRGTWGTIGNVGQIVSGSGVRAARAESDCATLTQYAQVDVVSLGTGASIGVTVRHHQNSASYYGAELKDGTLALVDFIGTTRTEFASASVSASFPGTLRVEVDDSELRGYWNGTLVVSGNHDGAHTTYPLYARTGLHSAPVGAGSAKFDNFESGDYVASGATEVSVSVDTSWDVDGPTQVETSVSTTWDTDAEAPPIGVRSVSHGVGTTFAPTASLTAPAGVQAGDYLVAFLHGAGADTASSISGGGTWALLAGTPDTGTAIVMGRAASDSEPASYTGALSSAGWGCWAIVAVSGVDTETAPVTAEGTGLVAPSLTPPAGGSLELAFVGPRITTAGTQGGPAGYDVEVLDHELDHFHFLGVASKVLTDDSATGTKTFTHTGTLFTPEVSFSVAVKSAGEAEPQPTEVSTAVDTSWNTEAVLSASVDTSWHVQIGATLELDTSWSVAGSVSSATGTAWKIRAVLSGSTDTSWHVREVLEDSTDTSWGVRTTAPSSTDTAWRTRATLSASASTTYDVRGTVTASLDTAWDVASISGVSSSVDTSWRVRSALSSDTDARWHVRASVSDSADTAWHVRDALTFATDTAWSVSAVVSLPLGTSWGVESTSSVSLSVDTSWDMAAVTALSADTSWQVRSSVSASADTSWHNYTTAASSTSTSYDVAAVASLSVSVRWASQSDAPIVDVSFHIGPARTSAAAGNARTALAIEQERTRTDVGAPRTRGQAAAARTRWNIEDVRER